MNQQRKPKGCGSALLLFVGVIGAAVAALLVVMYFSGGFERQPELKVSLQAGRTSLTITNLGEPIGGQPMTVMVNRGYRATIKAPEPGQQTTVLLSDLVDGETRFNPATTVVKTAFVQAGIDQRSKALIIR